MCIVIDTSTFSSVFEPTSETHDEFEPVFRWVTKGKGKVVYGGTQYKNELRRATKYHSILAELGRAGRTVEIDDQEVDREQQRLKDCLVHRDFDDSHLVAIVIVSGCQLICCADSRAYRFIKETYLYPKHPKVKPPKIYSRSSHKNLLCDQNIANVCKDA